MQKQVAVQAGGRVSAGGRCVKKRGKVRTNWEVGKWTRSASLSLPGSYLRLWPRALENTREKCRNKINRKGE